MLRWLTRTQLYLARQIKKKRPEPAAEPPQSQDEYFSVYNMRSQYQQVKQKYQKLDEQPPVDNSNGQKYKQAMSLIEKMLKNNNMSEQEESHKKQKIDIKEKFKRIGTPEELLTPKQQQTISLEDFRHANQLSTNIEPSQMSEHEQMRRYISESLLEDVNMTPEQRRKHEQRELKLAQQDMFLDEIMKKTKVKEIKHINQTNDKKDQYGFTQKQQNLMLRQQKIIQAYKNKQDPSVAKFNVTRQDLLNMKYSPQIIEKAKKYRSHELAYFKELVVEEGQDTESSVYQLNRRKFLSPQDQKRWQKLKVIPEEVKQISQNSYKKLKGQQGLVRFQDRQFYMQKAKRQLKQKEQLNQQDKAIIKELDKDLDEGNLVSDVFLDAVVYPQQAKMEKRMLMDDTSFGKQKKKLHQLTTKLDKMDVEYQNEDIRDFSKVALFEQKLLLQKEQNYQKFLHKKQKKKNMKKQLKQIHRQRLKDNVDFDKIEEPSMTIKQLKQASNIDMLEDNYEKVNAYNELKKSTLIQQTPEQKQSKIHHTKTFKKMHQVITMYFANGLFNHDHGQLDQIQIRQIVPNKINTVLNVFWAIDPKYLEKRGIIQGLNNYDQLFKQELKNLQKRLDRQSQYISGKMTRLLRLRYGPQIRFIYDEKTQQTQEAIDELKLYLRQIAMVQVEEYIKKGLITTEEKQVQYFEKLLSVAKSKLLDYNSRKQLLSKKYKKNKNKYENLIQQQINKDKPKTQEEKQTKQKKINPIFEDIYTPDEDLKKSNKKKKKNSVDKLWDTIDML